MKKQVFLFMGITLLLINVVSAYYYNPASIGTFFETLGGENLGLLIVFGISFALITVILNRTSFFSENRSAAIVISLMLAMGITYGTYRQGINFDVASLMYNFGISEMALDVMVFFGVLGLILLLLFKFGANSTLIIGGFILALTFTGVIQDPGILVLIGIGLVAVWIITMWIKRWKFKDERKSYMRGTLGLKDLTKRR